MPSECDWSGVGEGGSGVVCEENERESATWDVVNHRRCRSIFQHLPLSLDAAAFVLVVSRLFKQLYLSFLVNLTEKGTCFSDRMMIWAAPTKGVFCSC